MLEKSLDEYVEISTQIREANNAVIRYTITIISISGSLLAALTAFSRQIESYALVSVSILSIMIITALLQVIVNYKCNSHNRLAAYKSLISVERITPNGNGAISGGRLKKILEENESVFIGFDHCIENINTAHTHRGVDIGNYPDGLISRTGIFSGYNDDTEIFQRIESMFPIGARLIRNGENIFEHRFAQTKFVRNEIYNVRHFISIMLNRTKSIALSRTRALLLSVIYTFVRPGRGTWNLPLHVNRLFFVIMAIEFAAASFFALKIGALNSQQIFAFTLLLTAAVAIISSVAEQFVELVSGKRIVFAYFAQFVIFRAVYVHDRVYSASDNKLNLSIEYTGEPWTKKRERQLSHLLMLLLKMTMRSYSIKRRCGRDKSQLNL